jgi:hypothetical protein
LNTIASPPVREPAPLATLVRSRTVAKLDSIVIWSLQVDHDCDLGGFVEGGVLDEAS